MDGRPDPLPLSARRPRSQCAHCGRRAPWREGSTVTALVVARGLERIYEVRRGLFKEPGRLRAVGGISFALAAGETLAVVGESGCGKSTLARLITLVEKPTGGTLALDGVDAVNPPAGARRRLRRTVQLVSQDPYGSLNPPRKIGPIVEEPLAIHTTRPEPARPGPPDQMLAKVGLGREH